MINRTQSKTIFNLAIKNLKANRTHNLIIICAIVLTTLLITAVFTMGININASMERAIMKTTGGDYHGSFKYLTPSEVEKLKNHPSIKESGTSLSVGKLQGSSLKNNHVETLHVDESYAEHSFIDFIEGGLPTHENDIVLNTWVLDLLGVKPQLGQKVRLDINIGQKVISQDFKISGYYKADKNLSMSGLAFVSKAFTDKHISQINPVDSELNGLYVNTSQLLVLFKNSFVIENKLKTILADTGLEVEYGVNPAYSSVSLSQDLLNLVPYAVVILITMISGYLLIYNIFYIAVLQDVKFYGLLKTIGTTPRQLKRIITIHARSLYIIALPFGLGLGYVLGLLVTPLANSFSNHSLETSYSASPWIFLGAALFSYITVRIASTKPGRIASQISPIEAVRYSGIRRIAQKKIRKTKHGAKLHNMALSNIFRNKKKLFLVLSSLTLSIVLFSTIFTIISSLDVAKYLSSHISGDFVIQNEVLVDYRTQRSGDPYKLSPELIRRLSQIDGVNRVDQVYYRVESIPIDHIIRSVLEPFSAKPDPDPSIPWTLNQGKISVNLYGVDTGWYELLYKDVVKGEFDKEKFETGKYVLVTEANLPNDSSAKSYYQPGEMISFSTEGRSYEVMAVLKQDALYAATTKSYSVNGYNAFLPVSELTKGDDSSMIISANLHVEPDKLDKVEHTIRAMIDLSEELSIKSREDYKKELGGFIRVFQTIGYSLSIVIAMIGILNYINTVLTGVISRRNEFAILESIGMTKKQAKKVLVYEGFYIVLLTILFTSTIGVLITYAVSKSITESISFTVFQMSYFPFIFTLPVLMIISYTVTLLAYKTLTKVTIVERLRESIQ
ncbi:FtsX-like permease family protein [Paenibacillus sp. 7516]|uniref:FtsX-like permease family protein n=1 Tax=Paenibacillus sp. 7516 TaxID=2022549 RepID=UPI0014832520|nr:FtsX-like permease family protein [Paenibacillus sp. 7516]